MQTLLFLQLTTPSLYGKKQSCWFGFQINAPLFQCRRSLKKSVAIDGANTDYDKKYNMEYKYWIVYKIQYGIQIQKCHLEYNIEHEYGIALKYCIEYDMKYEYGILFMY